VDTELLRTFLEVNRTRHFGKAAANLYLTQSAVSARIRLLEQTVGVPLFTRDRNDIQLTSQGRKLVKHAETMLTAWNRARQEIALDNEDKTGLSAAGVPSLWDMMLPAWVETMCRELPDIVLSVEALDVDTILRRLAEKTLDLGLMLESPQMADLALKEFATIRFVMVSSRAGTSGAEAVGEDYFLVNWGAWFTSAHARNFPDLPTPTVRVGPGRVARALILGRGGSAYLAEPLIADDLAAGRLHLVADAPVIEREAFAVYPREAENRAFIERALAMLDAAPEERASAAR
jgi:LysR family transcriptional regulator, flagellar master operon regulator